MIGHTQPRRIAARTVANRIAQELGTNVGNQPGDAVGFQVRFTDQVGPTTLVKLMTDGILLAEIAHDPLLRAYDTIIIDEAHERSLNIDFLIGYLTQLLPKRPDLKVIITSATIDSQRFAEHFMGPNGQPAPVIEVSGRTYPVEIRYRPLVADTPGGKEGSHAHSPAVPQEKEKGNESANQTDPANQTNQTEPPNQADQKALVLEDPDADLPTLGYGMGEEIDYITGICHAVDELMADGDGDILVFLPGERDIRDTEAGLEDHLGTRFIKAGEARANSVPGGVEVMPLFSRLSAAQQQRIFKPHPRRRIVLATNVAETSLTVPGIRYVIDPGLARISRYSNRTKVQRLPIEPVSQASANQRSGRCGRVDDGVAIRLYSQRDFHARPRFTEPEILRTSLASVILQMAALGLGDVEGFPFLDAPAPRAIKDGVVLLEELGALRVGVRPLKLTRVGRQLARLPIDPRLARMLVEAGRSGCASEVLIIVAALSVQDVRERPAEHQQAADESHARFLDATSDFLTYLNIWRYLRSSARDMSNSAFRRMCRDEFLHYLRWREWQDVVGQLSQMAREIRIRFDTLSVPSRSLVQRCRRDGGVKDAHARAAMALTAKTSAKNADDIHRAVLVGLLTNIGMWDQARSEYQGTRGGRFVIWPGSGLARKHYEWVMAAELVETSRVFARTVARIQPEWVEKHAQRLVKHVYGEPYWSTRNGAAMVREKVMLYGLTLIADRPVLLANVPPHASFDIPQSATTLGSRTALGSGSALGPVGSVSGSPKELARQMFISHALVAGQWRGRHRFIAHNKRVLEQLEADAQKLRASSSVDEAALYAFFDERVPEDVYCAADFDHWWRGQADKRLLEFSRAALLGEESSDPSGYPSHWVQGDLSLPLRYEFNPGSPRDGVTVRVPVTVLARVHDVGFDWLVPGMLTELLTATIRALPKNLRTQLVPAPDVAGELAVWIRSNIWGLEGTRTTAGDPHSRGANGSSDSAAANRSDGSAAENSLGGSAAANSASGEAASSDSPGANKPQAQRREPKGSTRGGSNGPDPRSLEASLGRLAAWASKSGAASKKSIAKMRQQSQGGSAATSRSETGSNTGSKSASDAQSRVTSNAADSNTSSSAVSAAATPATSAEASGSDTRVVSTEVEPALPGTESGLRLPPFFTAFQQAVKAVKNVEVPADLWDQLVLPPHVVMRFEVVDAKGREIRSAEDLTWLQKQLASQSQQAVRSAMRDALQEAFKTADQQAFKHGGNRPGKQHKNQQTPRGKQRRSNSQHEGNVEDLRAVHPSGRAEQHDGTASQTRSNQTPRGATQVGGAGNAGGLIREQNGLKHWPSLPDSQANGHLSDQTSDHPNATAEGGVIPLDVEARGANGMIVRAYPCLVPQGSAQEPAAGLRLAPTRVQADAQHRQGLAHLVLAQVALSTTRVSTRWSGKQALVLASSPYSSTEELIAQAQRAATLSLIDEAPQPPYKVRTKPRFQALLEFVRENLEDRVYQVLGYVVDALAQYNTVTQQLRKHSSPSELRLVTDVKARVDALVNDRMLQDTPFAWLPHVARFVQAQSKRLDKASSSPTALARDDAHARSLAVLHADFLEALERTPANEVTRRAQLSDGLWLVQELAVQFFAQELGTSRKVSQKRLHHLLQH
ncbi:DUF3418 domain-containing protein [Gleimia hominis]|uniref:DUF3418 domain-containing protein n=2 Tax=Gleimia hominis TaxID=595468 RepID=A0ABU3IAC0_9ACTO|nr:DUF3418 domain-containing protein [Gleimia hominis]MDT3766851.1 DUF3418 domain-containing protein [Gleimia hominis]